jgi:eukaryotic-like serine/threonine-protein kinase
MTGDSQPGSPSVNAETTGSRWSELKALFDSALSLESSERQTFIDQRCGANEDLRRELESLLHAYEETGEFLERPAVLSVKSFAETTFPEAHSEDPQAGSRIGAYQLEGEIGRGGMGAVFLATRADSEYVKRVAIKLIRRGRVSDFAIRRFRNERQILARLEHAYVARLIDGGTTESGLPYFVMEYVEGQPVTQYCDSQSLNTRERLELFLKICSAVRYAHERNIIHRDLKPSNILVKEDGTPRLLDFGIAKIMNPDPPAGTADATLAGFRLLTPAYASPEQMRGDAATARSDIYSLGVILYELLCGERPTLSTFQRIALPFERPNEAHLSAHLRTIVFQAIRWDPDERYDSVRAFASDIRGYLEGLPPKAQAGVAQEFDTSPAQISIAILPFRALDSHDTANAFVASGITDVLIARLSRVERVSVRPTSAVLKYAERNDTVTVAKELRVKYVLEGSVHTLGEQVRISVQLVFAEAGIAVWAAQFDEPKKDLLKLEDSIAEQVAFALIPQLTGEERQQLSRSGTASGQAHEAYLRGRWHWSRSFGDPDELAKALVYFMQAIAYDPNYARAHAGLADYYLRLGLWGGLPPSESFAAAIDSAETAVRLDSTLGEAHASLAFAIWAYHRDYAKAEKHFNLAIIRSPDYASAHHWFGLLNSARNRPELAIANLERAQKSDPNSPVITAALGFVYYNGRQYAKAIQLMLEAAQELRKSAVVQEMLTWCYLQIGDTSKALESAQNAVRLSNRGSSSLCTLAHAEAATGNPEAAASLKNEIEEVAKDRYVSGYDRASAFLACGDTENAIRCLDQAFAARDWWVSWIAVEPRWDGLRHDPRFTKLVLSTQPAHSSETSAVSLQEPKAADSRGKRIALAGICAALLVALGLILWPRLAEQPAPFGNLKYTKLTSNGIANTAAISPDGNYVAYTVMAGGANDLWLRDLRSSKSVEMIRHLTGGLRHLTFTNGGREVSFVNASAQQPSNWRLFAIPVLGGSLHEVFGPLPSPASLSLDGERAAWFQANPSAGTDELWIVDITTGAKRRVISYRYPERFAEPCMPAWSADGKLIAYALEQRDTKGFVIRVYVANADTGSAQLVRSPRWQTVHRLAWSGNRSAITLVGQEQDSSFKQIWYVPYPRGQSRRIGDDLLNYVGVSLTADNAELVSVQEHTFSNIYLADASDQTHPSQITPGSGRYFDLSTLPDGRILYASDGTGSADIWMMNSDGSGLRQVTFGMGRNYAPASSSDGKIIVFHSNRSGNWNIWRADGDGSNPRQLSTSSRDANWPVVTPDGKFAIYHQADLEGAYHLWKVPVDGGRPVQITNAPTMHPAISRKHGKIAAWYSQSVENPHWKLAVFSQEGGEPLRVFEPTSASQPDTLLRWTPSGDAITFTDYAKDVSNIWIQPLSGGPPRRLTSFSSGDLYSFDWSQDGKLVYSRGLTSADVVLIKDTGNSK